MLSLRLTLLFSLVFGTAVVKSEDSLSAALQKIDPQVISAAEARDLKLDEMLYRDGRSRRQEVSRRETGAWREVQSRADWEWFRDVRIQKLRDSLGTFPEVPADLHVRVTRVLQGNGHRVENLVFESRPGLFVTANLYLPETESKSMPGILICHSHHNPKTQGELQDMGQLWARRGCLVLVMDQLGHGERRQHPFKTKADFAGDFKPDRQDYYFRYNTGMQLHLAGESLVGWMAWDLMRGVDLLLGRPGVDPQRIILLGAVAGGGDPAALTAALDRRITAVVPFNFGGPQPETTYPLPDDAELTFNYVGGGSWESTRNLRLSARDGFLPWVIVAAAAPRHLIYAHEFTWDRDRDPVWRRLEKVFSLCGGDENLSWVHGRGSVRGTGPENTHCNNIGGEHRKGIDAAFKLWFGIPLPDAERGERRPAADLQCWTPELEAELRPQPLHRLLEGLARERTTALHERHSRMTRVERLDRLRAEWTRLLGDVTPNNSSRVTQSDREPLAFTQGAVTVVKSVLETDPGILVPVVLLVPPGEGKHPAVVAFGQHGKRGFLQQRSDTIAECLASGMAVCLPDLRGTGETSADSSGGRNSGRTSVSSAELMLGRTCVGNCLKDLRSVLRHLRTVPEIDTGRIALWGDSFAEANPPETQIAVPLDAELPRISEPLGGLVALLGGLFEPEVRAVYARGGLGSCSTVLQSPFCWLPHDAIVPGAIPAGDLPELAAALAPRPLRIDAPVDGLNRLIPSEQHQALMTSAVRAYQDAGQPDRLQLTGEPTSTKAWFEKQLAASR